MIGRYCLASECRPSGAGSEFNRAARPGVDTPGYAPWPLRGRSPRPRSTMRRPNPSYDQPTDRRSGLTPLSRERRAGSREAYDQPTDRRSGLTLLEVLVSVAIFTLSVAALSQLLATGVRASVQSRLQTQAIIRCESKLAEMLVGVEPLTSVSDAPFEDDPNWVWSAEVFAAPVPDLLEVVVTVSHVSESNLGTVSFSLQRYVRDPQVVYDAWVEQSLQQSVEGGP
jgi:general secretion pathway protein I